MLTDKVIKKWRRKLGNMKKEDYIVLLLLGVLLLIISLPADRGQEGREWGVFFRREGTERGGRAERRNFGKRGNRVCGGGKF